MPKINKAERLKDADIGARIRTRRLLAGMSQTDLAVKVGVKFQQIQKYESGANGMSITRMKLLADALSVPPLYFIGSNEAVAQSNIKLVLTPGAAQMLAAFNKVQDSGARARLIELVERFAEVSVRKR